MAIDNPKYERSVSVQSSVPSQGGIFMMSSVEHDKQRSTSDVLVKVWFMMPLPGIAIIILWYGCTPCTQSNNELKSNNNT